ncbi:MAG: UTP--glucose-1-phosphate uridylyltransferase [Candidatus Staskawiczbacteria bacterium]|nr:UTP--glucose-1-phosphate uridylyltransferase [Candidatus Staskawiczbacteria bacterium]
MEENLEVKKAIIPVAGLGTRFLPLSLVVSKEFFPLVDKPVIQYIIEEVKNSGINEIVFVISPKQKMILNYLKKSPELEKLLTKRKKESALNELKNFEQMFEGINFSFAVQKQPHGDGHAILQAQKMATNDPIAVSFGDDVVDSHEPAILQLINIFKTCNAPVIALKSLPKEKIPAYGSVVVEKIANNLYKIKKIIEKPTPDQIQSNLVIVGKYVLTPDVFGYLKKAKPSEKGEIILGEVFDAMLSDGLPLYGYEVKGEWLECGDKLKWLKSFMYMALKDDRFGKELKDYLKTIK